jgi:hypothetical protein
MHLSIPQIRSFASFSGKKTAVFVVCFLFLGAVCAIMEQTGAVCTLFPGYFKNFKR